MRWLLSLLLGACGQESPPLPRTLEGAWEVNYRCGTADGPYLELPGQLIIPPAEDGVHHTDWRLKGSLYSDFLEGWFRYVVVSDVIIEPETATGPQLIGVRLERCLDHWVDYEPHCLSSPPAGARWDGADRVEWHTCWYEEDGGPEPCDDRPALSSCRMLWQRMLPL